MAIGKVGWTAPKLVVVELKSAAGARLGAHCDKFGSLSATLGNDRCAADK